MSLDPSLCVRPHKDTLVRELEGEAVLLSLASGNYYSLDSTGLAVWNALTASATVHLAVTALLGELDVDRATLESDVAALVEELRAEGLIDVTPGQRDG